MSVFFTKKAIIPLSVRAQVFGHNEFWTTFFKFVRERTTTTIEFTEPTICSGFRWRLYTPNSLRASSHKLTPFVGACE